MIVVGNIYAGLNQNSSGTVVTANGISGNGSAGTPVVLGGTLNAATTVALNGKTLGFSDSNFNLNILGTGIGISMTNGASTGSSLQVTPGDFLAQVHNSVGSQSIEFALASGMTVTDVAQLIGLVYAADYSAKGHLNPLWIPNWGYVQANIGIGNVTAVKDTGLSANTNLIAYVMPFSNPSQYQVNASVVFRSGTGSAQIQLVFVDPAGNTQTQTVSGATSAAGSFGTTTAFTVLNGSTINVNLVIIGAGHFDCSAAISFIN